MTHLVAIDLGNESGRIMSVRFDGSHISSSEVYRFSNHPVVLNGTLYWDVLRLWHEVEAGIARALEIIPAAGIAVDSFGVDFGLLDAGGTLISNPVHMRDNRTNGMMDWVFERVPRATIFERTGIGFYIINTLYQLAAIRNQSPWQLDIAETLLTMPNLFTYWLTGERVAEFTHTTTTQCFNPTTGTWDCDTLDALGIATDMLPPVVQPGKRVGAYHEIPVFTVASHDTGSAVAAVPTETPDYAYISSGTWSLIGMELPYPVISEAALAANVTNEGGVAGTYRMLNLVMGLWLLQQCRVNWTVRNIDTDYDVLLEQADSAEPFRSLIDPDNPVFFPPGDMIGRIQAFCQQTGQIIPKTVGEIVRCVLESLALKYRYTLERHIQVTGRTVETIHIVGGGSQNPLLCQMTANATQRPVLAGPVEATALGNGLVQLIALGELDDLAQARAVIRASYPPKHYHPVAVQAWDDAYRHFCGLCTTST